MARKKLEKNTRQEITNLFADPQRLLQVSELEEDDFLSQKEQRDSMRLRDDINRNLIGPRQQHRDRVISIIEGHLRKAIEYFILLLFLQGLIRIVVDPNFTFMNDMGLQILVAGLFIEMIVVLREVAKRIWNDSPYITSNEAENPNNNRVRAWLKR